MSRPIDRGPDPTVLGEHYCGGPLRQHAEQGSVASMEGCTLAQCTACGELLILTDHDRVERPADVWWDR